MSNSEPIKPTAKPYYDDFKSQHDQPVPHEELAEYLMKNIDDQWADRITSDLCAAGLTVDQTICTLIGALASFLADVYLDDEQRACNTFGHVTVFGHALMHQMIASDLEAREKDAAKDLPDSEAGG